jgi:3-dehydroquinate synthase
VPAGERQKSLSAVGAVTGALLEDGLGRDGTILALGGGVIGDLAGLVAATYQRGIALVQMPTTLLAQVDSSIGGKVGVNHPLGKNMIGAFHQPRLVWADGTYLRTLPAREVICGLAEVVKYAIIRDGALFSWLESHLPDVIRLKPAAVHHVQLRCARIKAMITAADEREQGLRAILNHGHTVGHALEAAGQFRLLKHGEAVLLGIAAECRIACDMGLLTPATHKRIADLVRRIPVRRPRLDPQEIIGHMRVDKKNREGRVRFLLPTRIGRVQVEDHVDPDLIELSIRHALRRSG